ncbi:hypothetical protein B0T22DRAFT_466379 [Podospora appendiculata]|uniref:Secreted protein n=1 Tax=Podospora appendiculata TaxID=314037 RepID=A0AAE0X5R8_9PEZI|nr:hypothetical protein B0T22DRAFT_466379 [Podospora appendiculata]
MFWNCAMCLECFAVAIRAAACSAEEDKNISWVLNPRSAENSTASKRIRLLGVVNKCVGLETRLALGKHSKGRWRALFHH